jgi:hypothetical protein
MAWARSDPLEPFKIPTDSPYRPEFSTQE